MSDSPKVDQLFQAIDLARTAIIDTVALELEDNPHWESVRNRLLRIMGDRGLEGQVRSLLGMPQKGKK
jgi:hypothetical protein